MKSGESTQKAAHFLIFPPKVALAIFLALNIAVPFLAPFLKFNDSPDIYIPNNAPSKKIEDQVREIFPEDDVIIALFEGEDLVSEKFFVSLQKIAEAIQAHKFVDKVIAVTNEEHISGIKDGFEVTPLVNLAEDYDQDKIISRLKNDRFAHGRTLSTDLKAFSMVVRTHKLTSSLEQREVFNLVKTEIAKQGLSPKLTALAGTVAVSYHQFETALSDNKIFVPLIMFVGFLLLWLLFRKPIVLALTAGSISVTMGGALALQVLLDQPLNSISELITPLLSALVIALLLHLFYAAMYMQRRGYDNKEAVIKAVEQVFVPSLYAALTTIFGLLSLTVSEIPPIRYFGLSTALGVAIGFFTVMYLVAPILMTWGRKPWPKAKKRKVFSFDHILMYAAKISLRYPVQVVVTFVLLFIVSAPQISKVVVETNILRFFRDQHPITTSTRRVQEKLSGTTSLEVYFKAKEEGYFKKPEALLKLRAFQKWAESQPEIDLSISVAEFIEDMHWAFNNQQKEFRVIPENRRLISQYLFINDGEDIYDFVDQEFTRVLIPLNVNVHGAKAIGRVVKRIQSYLEENGMADVSADVSGFGRLFYEQEILLIDGQSKGIVIAVFLIFIFLVFLWRSFLWAFICMIPNLAPVAVMFIVMGMANIWFDFATAMISCHIVGIAVDDTIHIFHKINEGLKSGKALPVAVMRTFKQSGRAVVATTFVLCSQFFFFIFSDFVPVASYGLLSCIGLISALIFDLLLLPAIVAIIYRVKLS